MSQEFIKTSWHHGMELFSTLLAYVTGGIPSQMATDVGSLCFLFHQPKQADEQTVQLPVIF